MNLDQVGKVEGENSDEYQAYRGACNYLRNSLFWRAVDALSHEAKQELDLLIKLAESKRPTSWQVSWLSMAAALALLAASGLAQDALLAIKHDIQPAKIVPQAMHADKIREQLKIERLGGERVRPSRVA